jgi:hypothetical protein
MARKALSIRVPAKDRKELRDLLSGGVQHVRVVLRALALSQLAKGVSAPRISGVVPLTPQAIRNVAHRYEKGGSNAPSTRKHGPERFKYWTMARNSGLSRWSAVIRGRVAPLDRSAGGRRSGEAATGPSRGKRDRPRPAAPPRPQAVAGNKCGGRSQ